MPRHLRVFQNLANSTPEGFTLIELLLSIGIIGITSTVVIVATNPQSQLCQAQDAKRNSTTREIRNGLVQYIIDNSSSFNASSTFNIAIPSGVDNAVPICMSGVSGDSSCIQIFDELTETYVNFPDQDISETNANYSGYKLYQQDDFFFVTATYAGNCNTTSTTSESGGGTSSVDTSGLVGHWKFDDNSGTTAVDSSSGGNDGTLTNMDPGTDWVNGVLNKALDFDGTDDYVHLAEADLMTSSYSIALWFKADALSGTPSILSQEKVSGSHDRLEINSSNELNFKVRHDSTWVEANVGISTDTWYHAVGIVDTENDVLRLYLDGNLQDSQAFTGVPRTADAFTSLVAGEDTGIGTNEFDGRIDDIRIYNRVLDAAEITALADSEVPNGLVAHWKMEEASSSVATDYTDNNNLAELNNMDAGSDWVTGTIGSYAIDLDGSDDFLLVYADPLGTNYTNYTQSVWVRTSASTQGFLMQRTDTGDDNSIASQLHISAAGLVSIDDYLPSGGGFAGSTAVNDGDWHHIAVTRAGTTRRIYVDGTLDGTQNSAETYSGNTPDYIYIGVDARSASFTNRFYFDGTIDDFRLYNRALSADEVSILASQ